MTYIYNKLKVYSKILNNKKSPRKCIYYIYFTKFVNITSMICYQIILYPINKKRWIKIYVYI